MKNNKDVDSLSHTTWRCQYHVVFAPKYRRMVIYGQIKKDIGQILRKLCEQKDIEIIEAEACPDHIHMLISFSPKYSISYVMGYIKMVDVFSGFVHLYSYYYKLNAEGGVEKWIPYEYNLYRNILVTSSSFDKAFNDTYKGFIKPQSEYPDAYSDTFYISQKLSNSTGNRILDVLNDAFSDGSSEWVGYKGGFFSYNDDACVLVTAKGMSFSESGDYSLTYVDSGKTTTLTDSRGFEREADIYYAYNTDEFSEAYENLNTVDNEIADESSLIFEFLIGNENYTDWQ